MEYDTNQIILKNPPWWRRRTNLERRVMVLLAIFVVIALGLTIGITWAVLKHKNDEFHWLMYGHPLEPIRECINCFKEAGPVCLTSGCIHTASLIRKYMDPSVNPCDNFYQYACGGFQNETNLPGDVFTNADDLIQEQLRTIIEEDPGQRDAKPYHLLRRLYNMCMDTKGIEEHGLITVKYVLQNLGGWPVLEGDTWNEHTFDWTHTVYNFRKAGYSVDYYLSLDVVVDPGNSSQYVLVMDQADLGLEHEILAKGINDERVSAYYTYMVDVAGLLGAEVVYATKELKASLELEIAIAKISISKKDVWNATVLYHPMTVGELQRRYPEVNWVEYINGVVHLPEYRVTFQDQIIVKLPGYVTELLNLLRWTPRRVQANYVMWRAVKFSVGFLTEPLRNRQLAFYKSITKFAERKNRWKECVEVVSLRLRLAAGSLYVHKFVDDNAMDIVYEIVTNIRDEFMGVLKNLQWMDDSTKQVALEKVEEMTIHAAYSDELLSIQKLQRYYAQLEISDNYLTSILNISAFDMDNYFRKLTRFFSKSDLNPEIYTTTVFADYQPSKNSIELPSGLLQGLFFSTDRPQYMNYGALGYIIGHEMAHGFDDTGRQYDRNGNLYDWWTQYTKREFEKFAQCVSTQYRNRTVPEIELYANAIETYEDNIANHAGLKAAYLAYITWARRYGDENYLPSLGYYTPQQLFWISAAQTHCTKYEPEYMKREGYSEQRNPAFFKVQEAFSNSEYFAKDFRCPYGSAMNPMNKCHVW